MTTETKQAPETLEMIADRIAATLPQRSKQAFGFEQVRDDILSALRNERERCAKVLETRADELQVEWDAPPSAENGFVAMTADTPAGYATWYCMNQLRKLAEKVKGISHAIK